MTSKIDSITVHVGPRWWFRTAVALLLVIHRYTGWTPSAAFMRALTKYGIYARV